MKRYSEKIKNSIYSYFGKKTVGNKKDSRDNHKVPKNIEDKFAPVIEKLSSK